MTSNHNGKNKIYIILGKKGSGKTTKSKELIDLSKRKNVFVYDFLGEYIIPGGVVINNLVDLIDLIELNEGSGIKAVLREFEEKDFDVLCNLLWHIGDSLLVVEEADNVCSSSFISDWFKKLIRYGRHRGIDIVAISRRPADINRLLTSQADVFYIYQFIEPTDLDYIKRINADLHPEKLEKYQYKEIKT